MPVTIKFPVASSDAQHRSRRFDPKNMPFDIKIDKDCLKHSGMFSNVNCSSGNGFIDAVTMAYNQHKNLIITPDMLWTTILTSLMAYVEANAEKLRSNFVSHEGKKTLTLNFGGNYANVSVDRFAELFIEQINANTKQSSDWLQCDFTTTTAKERTASSLLVMAGFQQYFKYEMMFCCGIPEVHLMGEKCDYEKIRKKVENIGLLGDSILGDWCLKLLLIIDQFILAFDDNNSAKHEDFWSKIVTREGYGSGSRSFINGWLATLCPFVIGKNRVISYNPDRISLGEVPLGFMTVPISIDDNGNKFDVKVYVGQFGYEFDNDTFSSRVDYIITKS
jgi:hypothetical protein